MKKRLILSFAACLLAGCDAEPPPAESADDFVARINTELEELNRELGAAEWVRATYITGDTAILSALANERYAEWHSRSVAESLRYEGSDLAPQTARALKLLKLGISAPAPADAARRRELTELTTELKGMYGAGKYCPDDGRACMSLQELSTTMEQSRDYDVLLDAWLGWRRISPPMRDKYRRYAELANEGAAELGFRDLGDMWKSGYDMSPVEFERETSKLWQQVEPLYHELHCHVRGALGDLYGRDKVPPEAPIPAHLLGNMWAQTWGFLYDLLEPFPGVADLDIDAALKQQNYTPVQMVESAERFYVSLGLHELPNTFWQRSIFEKPADRDIVCHPSAWGLDGGNDLRIKMCIKQTYDELRTIYHELGHNYYQSAYKHQPPVFQGGAHNGFHEAIGDTVTLSMTPAYLHEVGLVSSVERNERAVINRQMQQALDKIAFLPFGKMIDEWRWGVFSGAIAPEDYNRAWWELRTRYQGIAPPAPRSESDFDPGAKYHIPANVSYTRYFLAHVLQFQFHRALCRAAGFDGPLHECSIYGSKAAGDKLWAMLEAGQSEPWQTTLEKLTGTREMDASAIIDYFAPLMSWLREQNSGRDCGW